MPYLRHVREMLLLAYYLRYIDEVEFVILYDLNKTKRLEIPYWQYYKFDLESMNMMSVGQSLDLKKNIYIILLIHYNLRNIL